MNRQTETRNYRSAFLVAVIVNIALIAGLGVFWWHSHATQGGQTQTQPATLPETGNPEANDSNPGTPAATQSQTQLVPIQLTPQRLQSIGVKFANVEYKNVNDEIRVTGNVDMDEKKLSYIQVRFPGWIRKVYADATYQYVRKGQPLFTVYSPDLVATEQEYLLARQNQQQLQSSSIGGVSDGAASLVNAARERLRQWEVSPSEISKLETTGKAITDLTFNSPVSGYITEKNVLPNMYVQPETRLYTVADLSTVWVNAQVFQTDLSKIRPGDAAQITVD